MKKILSLIVSTSLLVLACDKVENPIVKKNTAVGSKFVENNNASVANFRKILLEDYTGQTCPNCPTAADLIREELLPRYKDSLIVIAVHQGNTFAKPTITFTNDFRTEAGEEWGKTSGFGIAFYPCGLINRKDYGTGRQVANQSWSSTIPKAIKEPFIVRLNVNTSYDTTVRALNVTAKGTFLQAYPNPTKISMVYIQEGIAGKQKKGSSDIEEYDFEHMLRGDLNGVWGQDFKAAALANDSATVSVTNFALPENVKGVSTNGNAPVDDKQVSVIVFVYDATTKVVLQVEKLKIRPTKSASAQ